MAGNRLVGQVRPEEGNTVGNTENICSGSGTVGLAGHSAFVLAEAWVQGWAAGGAPKLRLQAMQRAMWEQGLVERRAMEGGQVEQAEEEESILAPRQEAGPACPQAEAPAAQEQEQVGQPQ
jgi:hypothetical protein